MFPGPSSRLPVVPWINVSVSLGKAAQIFSHFKFSSPLLLAVLLPYYVFRIRIFSENILRYITFDALENYILNIYSISPLGNAVSSPHVNP